MRIPKRIPPPGLLLVCLVFMALLRMAWPAGVFLGYPANLAGLVAVALGLLIGVLGVVKFRRERTNIHPFKKADKLVTNGVYRYSRNPMYLGLTLILVGAWVLLGAVSPILGVLLFVLVADRWYIPGEERMLRERFGKFYEEYRTEVRRWL